MSKDLYVKHISADATEDDLRKLFAVCGKVTYVHMVMDAKSGQFVGCAFVKMSTDAEARDALVSLDGALLINRSIAVVEALPRKPKRPGGNRPVRDGARPARTSDRPARTSDRPARTSDRPARTGDSPSRTGDSPSRTGNSPSRTGDRPARTGDRPKGPRHR